MNLILSADRQWGIGRENRLLFRIPGDMAFFRRMTAGKVVVMGRKTLDSLPGGRPLPDRENIVLTRDAGFRREGVGVCRSLPALFARLAAFGDDDLFVIGGEQVYRLLLPYCRRAYVTRWDAVAEADAFMPDLDKQGGWRLAERSETHSEMGVDYRFCTYEQERPKNWREEAAPLPGNEVP